MSMGRHSNSDHPGCGLSADYLGYGLFTDNLGYGLSTNYLECGLSTDHLDCGLITKPPESGDLCGNISEFGVVEGSPEPADLQTNGSFVFISYCLMILCHFQLRYMR